MSILQAEQESNSSIDHLAAFSSMTQQIQDESLLGARSIIENVEHEIAIDASNERVQEIRRLGQLLSGLSYNEYLAIEDITSSIRKGTSIQECANRYNIIVNPDVAFKHGDLIDPSDNSETIDEVLKILYDLKDTQGFEDDGVLFLRSIYPYGKNILNKNFEDNTPYAYRPIQDTSLTITVGVTEIIVNGSNDSSCTISAEGQTVTLKEGGSVVVGRSLYAQKYFGKTVNEISEQKIKDYVHVKPTLEVEDTNVSRAGIIFTMKDGLVYALDRGSRQTVNFSVQRNGRNMYAGYFEPNKIGHDDKPGESITNTMEPDDSLAINRSEPVDNIDERF